MYGRETFVARMPDAGMAPGILEGDYFYADPDEPARAGGIVAMVAAIEAKPSATVA